MGERPGRLRRDDERPNRADRTPPPALAAETAPVGRVLDLQRLAGNRAVAQLLTVQRDPPPPPPAPVAGTVVDRLHELLHTVGPEGQEGALLPQQQEEALRLILENRANAGQLKQAYQDKFHVDLYRDVVLLGPANAVRARDYLDAGTLRAMSKVLIALAGAGTDTTTLFRVLADAHAEGDPTGKWNAIVTGDRIGDLPAFAAFVGSSLDESLDDDLDGYELVKAHVVLDHGEPRPIDQIFLAMDQAGTDEALLFRGLAAANHSTVEADFEKYEYKKYSGWNGSSGHLLRDLQEELSGEDLIRALALLGYNENLVKLGANERLVALVRAAVAGIGTNTELIWDAVRNSTPGERAALRTLVEDPADPLGLRGWTGDLSDADFARLRSMLSLDRGQSGAGEAAGDPGFATGTATEVINDATVRLLRSLGGVDSSTVFDAIKMSYAPNWSTFKTAWNDERSPFHRYVADNVSQGERRDLAIVLADDLRRRIDWCVGTFSDDEDYLFLLLERFATDRDRRALSEDPGFRARVIGSLSSTEKNRAEELLRPSDQTPEERAAWLDQAVGRERSGFFDAFTQTGDAVQDENRELKVRAGEPGHGPLGDQLRRTENALKDYSAARDEFANTASMVVNVAVGVIAAALTAGAAGPIVAAQLARAAAAMALTKVITEKAIRGDRFDMFGADGAVAFASGAVDGVMTVVGGVAARGVATNLLAGLGVEAEQLARSAYGSTAVGMLRGGVEGGLSGGASGLVDSMARDETWRNGFLNGVETSMRAAGVSAAVGAAASAGTVGVLEGAAALRSAASRAALTESVLAGDQEAARTFIGSMGRWETGIQALRDGSDFAADLAPGVREQLVRRLQAHRQNVVTILAEQFDAHPVASASTDAVSDVDLSVRGDQAGANLMAAEAFLDGRYPGWREKYRMALMIDAGRIGTYAEALEGLAPDVRAAIQTRVTREAETLTLARRVRNAEGAEREALLRELPEGTDAGRVRQLAELGEEARTARRNQALHQGDQLLARMRQATDPAERARLAEQVTYQQMLANAMGDDAYISPGGVRRFVQGGSLRNPHELFQAAADQVDMAAHAVHDAGGVLQAMRRYELFKYIRRFCDVVESAGIEDPQLAFFKNWSETVYRLDRVATRDAARESIAPENLASGWQERSGVRYNDLDGPTTPPSDEMLLNSYRNFQGFAQRHASTLRSRALGEGSGGSAGARFPDTTPLDTAMAGRTTTSAMPRGAVPVAGGFNQPIGRVVSSEAEGNLLLRRLASGDVGALTDLGLTPPAGFKTTDCEWGLGRLRDGSLRIVQGAAGAVSWPDDIVGVAHSHPTVPGRELKTSGVHVTDLVAGQNGASGLDLVHVFPSASDLIYSAWRQVPVHEVHVPYVHLGGGRIGNAGEAGTPITFKIIEARVAHHLGNRPIAHCSIELWAGGKLEWHGVLWGMDVDGSSLISPTFMSVAQPGPPPGWTNAPPP